MLCVLESDESASLSGDNRGTTAKSCMCGNNYSCRCYRLAITECFMHVKKKQKTKCYSYSNHIVTIMPYTFPYTFKYRIALKLLPWAWS